MRRNLSIPNATRDSLRVTVEDIHHLERPLCSHRNGKTNRVRSGRQAVLSSRSSRNRRGKNSFIERKSSEADGESVITMSKIEKKKNTFREGSKVRESKPQINLVKDELSSANPFGPAIENVDAASLKSEDKNSESNSQLQEGTVYSEGSSDEEDLYDDFKIHEMMDL